MNDESAQLEDQLERFRLWVGDTCHAPGRYALADRLRSSPEVQRRALELLLRLLNVLKIVTESPPDEADCTSDQATSARLLLNELPSSNTLLLAEKSWTSTLIDDTITRLFKLSASQSRNASVGSSRRQATLLAHTGVLQVDPSNDASVIRNKFPDGAIDPANNWLLERLGKANATRREMLLYRQLTAATSKVWATGQSSASDQLQAEEGMDSLNCAVPQQQGPDSTSQRELSVCSDDDESCWRGVVHDASDLTQRSLLVYLCCDPAQTFSEVPAWR
ncbi:hypothetical protein LTR17_003765 [Elasticomyces elasticus]|nr:hypothetical protein LTR17_003765 [Elasticomyces elasticus]